MLAMAIIKETVERLNKPLITRQVTGTKRCTSCGVDKPINDFHRDRRKTAGYKLECKECCKERIAKWQQENPDKMKAIWNKDKRRRRKLVASSAPYLSPVEWQNTLINFNHSCAYCGSHDELFQDHVIPIGSSNSGAYIVPACKQCNSSKGDMNINQWYTDQDFYSQERHDKVIQCLK